VHGLALLLGFLAQLRARAPANAPRHICWNLWVGVTGELPPLPLYGCVGAVLLLASPPTTANMHRLNWSSSTADPVKFTAWRG
jgi:hypothetical protein